MLTPQERNDIEKALKDAIDPKSSGQIDLLIEVLVSSQSSSPDLRMQAAARTKIYKVRQILRGAPSSDDVMAMCGYVMLQKLGRSTVGPGATEELLDRLVWAGFDREQSRQVVSRLTHGATERLDDWKTRVSQRRVRRLAKMLIDPKTQGTGNTG